MKITHCQMLQLQNFPLVCSKGDQTNSCYQVKNFLSYVEQSRYQGQQLMEFSKLMFQQRTKFCQIIKIPKEAHHRHLSDSSTQFILCAQIFKPVILCAQLSTTHSRVVKESRFASTSSKRKAVAFSG